MAENLFDLEGIHFIEISEIRYGWGFVSLERPKQGTTGISSIEKVKIR